MNETVNAESDNNKMIEIANTIKDPQFKEEFIKFNKRTEVSDNIKNQTNKKILENDLDIVYTKMSEKQKSTLNSLPFRDRVDFLVTKKKKRYQRVKTNNLDDIIEKTEKTENTEKTSDIKELIKYPEMDIQDIQQEEVEEIIEEPDVNTEESNKEKNEKLSKNQVQKEFNNLIHIFYELDPIKSSKNYELEIKFNTFGSKNLTISDFDNVVKKLKSVGFTLQDNAGVSLLRINNEFLDKKSGNIVLSNIRSELSSLEKIQEYCKHNNLKKIYDENQDLVNFYSKKKVFYEGEVVRNVKNTDFNFNFTLSEEENVSPSVSHIILENWKKSKKTFRYLNRFTFTHNDFPFNIDLSIVKSSSREKDKFGREGRGEYIRVYNIEDSNLFKNKEEYEIEIEVNNKKIGPGTNFKTEKQLAISLRKMIKYILSGLQMTNYPVSFIERKNTLTNYLKMVWKDDYDEKRHIDTRLFIGPSSKTLQLDNITSLNNDSLIPNIRNGFVVTEKADGLRNLLYVPIQSNKVYMIDMNMNVIFTGAKIDNEEFSGLLLDGELIKTDKNGKSINLFAAFDIYFFKNDDIRSLPFMQLDNQTDIYKCRYQLMSYVVKHLNLTSVVEVTEYKENMNNNTKSPIKVITKEFYPYSSNESIFEGCNKILSKVEEGRFNYETDGLIFSHAYYGVGGSKIGETGPLTKKTWNYSFKWKPPHLNTIDFLVSTVKSENGDDLVTPVFESGFNVDKNVQLSEYKTVVLRCGFNEILHGYLNPCKNVFEDEIPQYSNDNKVSKQVLYPMRFYPSEPYDEKAGLAKIMLKKDENGKNQMYSDEMEVFSDNMIVEFSYDINGEDGWKWKPLRVRHDKTTELRNGNPQYGNAYSTANNNWKSLHFPISEEMIRTGLGIGNVFVNENIYYNTSDSKSQTIALRNFHNLYVKRNLIYGVSKPGDKLIDFACGKGGDFPKWIESKLSMVYGIDISSDNIENRLDGACARYLNNKRDFKNVPDCLFLIGNSAQNIKSGEAMNTEREKRISKAIFGEGNKDPQILGKGVVKMFGQGQGGFEISSCQFATHYFFKNPSSLLGFMKNIAQCTKLNGHFIGTCYDGKEVFNLLRNIKEGEGINIMENGKKIWEIKKDYSRDQFEDNSSSLGYTIDVFQETINQFQKEYLVNFQYMIRVMESFGFKVISDEEAKDFGFPKGSSLFSSLYDNMIEEIKNKKLNKKNIGLANKMTSFEKQISFLNRYFIFKKIREVNVDKVEIELSEYSESEVEYIEKENKKTQKEITSIKKTIDKSKENEKEIKKLPFKIKLVPGTEALVDDENQQIPPANNESKAPSQGPTKTIKKPTKKKLKKLIVEE